MNKKLLLKILELHNVLQNFNTKNCPKVARSIYIKTNYIVITFFNYIKLCNQFKELIKYKDIIDIYNYLEKLKFITDYELKFINTFMYNNTQLFNELFKILKENSCSENIFNFYEELLSFDVILNNNKYCITKENKARDRSGAYYTSEQLADEVNIKVLTKYLEKKLKKKRVNLFDLDSIEKKEATEVLINSKFTDLSCGTGHFLISLVKILKKIISSETDLKKIICNISAFDIDFIALQILKIEFILKINDISLIYKISPNFIIGNTLINIEEIDNFNKLNLISEGYINHSKLGINHNKYDNAFDIIIGNPPWEKIRFEDKNFFTNYYPEISKITKKNEREEKIKFLGSINPSLEDYYNNFKNEIETSKTLIKNNLRMLHSAFGELNTYSLFSELSVAFLKKEGFISLIVKSSLITSSSNSKLFSFLLENNMIISLDDFINKLKIFPIDSRERFTVITLSKYTQKEFSLKMMLTAPSEINQAKNIILNKTLLNKINPINKMIPNISSKDDLKILISLYNNFNIFEFEFPKAKFGRLVHLTSHARFIHKTKNENLIPIFEGKFIERYDNKFSTFEGLPEEKCYASKANAQQILEENKNEFTTTPTSRYFIEETKWKEITKNYPYKYSIVWRSLTSATNKRITLASLLKHRPTTQSIQLLQYEDNYEILLLILSLFNSVIFDFIVKLKLNGIDLTQSIIKQIPVPSINSFNQIIIFKNVKSSIKNLIIQRIIRLYKNDFELIDFFKNFSINENDYAYKNRKEIVLEIDYLISLVYKLSPNELKNIIKEFPKDFTDKDIDYINQLK